MAGLPHGAEFLLRVFYLPPIAAVAWYGGKWLGIIAALEGACIWFLADYFSETQPSIIFNIWNAFVRLCFFAITVFCTRSLRTQVTSLQQSLNDKTKEVQTFHRLLPICSSCKRIRDELGTWHIMEDYIKERTDMELNQSICPDCAERYGETG